jgi:acyl-CoA dehydrogenase
MPYRAPVSEYRFLMTHVAAVAALSAHPRFADATAETVEALLSGAARLADEVWAPLNRAGDRTPARLENGIVRTSPGFADGFRAAADLGVTAMTADPAHGGLGLPIALATPVNEMLSGACLSLQLAPLMVLGQIEALERHADDQLKALYLPHLIDGSWTGTMNLTEPQAGSDVGALRTRAEPAGDGTYRITGQKIYITWADNDFAENVVHLVLARLPDAAPGTKGISLFVVPKLIPDANGHPGQPNALRVVSLEHKLGLHGSPTAVMDYAGATGWMVGPPGGGMAAMFTMMNNARLGVGVQGIGIAEAAYQAARSYAEGRVQGGRAIIGHADVRRMLGGMAADILAARSIALHCAVAIDMASATGAPHWQARAALLTPIAKAFGTDVGARVAQEAIQVHGGMGFIEETGVAQFARDVRVTQIYEGTNGIQALDLVGRKLADGGEAALTLIEEVIEAAEAARPAHPSLAGPLWQAAFSLREATEALVDLPVADRGGVAVPYLAAFARVLGGAAHLAAARAGGEERARLAALYMAILLPEHAGHLAAVKAGPDALAALRAEDLPT